MPALAAASWSGCFRVRHKIEYADDKLKGALPRLARASIDDVMAAVGRGEMKASDVARAMYPDYKEERVARYGVKKSLAVKLKLKSPPDPSRSPSAIPVRGINSDLPVKFAPNGGAVPGDRIVGPSRITLMTSTRLPTRTPKCPSNQKPLQASERE